MSNMVVKVSNGLVSINEFSLDITKEEWEELSEDEQRATEMEAAWNVIEVWTEEE